MLHRTCTSGSPDFQSPHEMYFWQNAPLQLYCSTVFAPGLYRRKHTNKDQTNALPCFCVGFAKNHPSGPARVLVEGTRPDAITRDVSWCELPSGKKSCLVITNSSAPQVTSDSSKELSPRVNREDIDSVSSDTRNDASVED